MHLHLHVMRFIGHAGKADVSLKQVMRCLIKDHSADLYFQVSFGLCPTVSQTNSVSDECPAQETKTGVKAHISATTIKETVKSVQYIPEKYVNSESTNYFAIFCERAGEVNPFKPLSLIDFPD